MKLAGFKEQKEGNLNVALGAELAVPVRLKLESVAETVEVTAEAGAIINPSATGPACWRPSASASTWWR